MRPSTPGTRRILEEGTATGRWRTSGSYRPASPRSTPRFPALRALGRPVAERVEELSYLLQRMDDAHHGHGMRRYWKGLYFSSLPDEALDAFLLRGTPDGSGEGLPAATLEPFATGIYVNAMSDVGAAGVARAYPPAKLARLMALKTAYDPGNVFHLNQDIRPQPIRNREAQSPGHA
jgi:hypothetical protein